MNNRSIKDILIKTTPFGGELNPSSKYLVIGVPLENTVTYKPGTRFAPQSIRSASCNIEFFSIYSSIDIDEILYNDLGDIPIIPGDNIESLRLIKNVIAEIYSNTRGKKLFVLGGEHTLTYGVLKGVIETKGDTCYIVFDAHLDLRENYQGNRYTHASTNRIIYEELLSQKGLSPIIIGARAFSKEEIEYANEKSIPYISSLDITHNSTLSIIKDAISVCKNLYISIDMDVIDPGYAPGVSNPEPLGLTPIQLFTLLNNIIEYAEGSITCIDIVEVNPLVDVNDVTSILAAKIIVETTGMIEKAGRSYSRGC